MSKEQMYRQCKVEKWEGFSKISRIFWGPEQHTVVGKQVKIEEDNGEWSEDWIVAEVYRTSLPERLVQHRSHDHTRQRKSSDI